MTILSLDTNRQMLELHPMLNLAYDHSESKYLDTPPRNLRFDLLFSTAFSSSPFDFSENTCNVPWSEVHAILELSYENDKDNTWHSFVPLRSSLINFFSVIENTRISVPFSDAVANSCPSGDNSTHRIPLSWHWNDYEDSSLSVEYFLSRTSPVFCPKHASCTSLSP